VQLKSILQDEIKSASAGERVAVPRGVAGPELVKGPLGPPTPSPRAPSLVLSVTVMISSVMIRVLQVTVMVL
jgi:hypothetical protein